MKAEADDGFIQSYESSGTLALPLKTVERADDGLDSARPVPKFQLSLTGVDVGDTFSEVIGDWSLLR